MYRAYGTNKIIFYHDKGMFINGDLKVVNSNNGLQNFGSNTIATIARVSMNME